MRPTHDPSATGFTVKKPTVYVLLVNWRGWEDTIECLESVFHQDYPSFHVVICNNDPADDSLARIADWALGATRSTAVHPARLPKREGDDVRLPKTILLDRIGAEAGTSHPGAAPSLVLIETGENLGFAGGNNVGLRYILAQPDADYVWLLNNDTIVDGSALRAMVELSESRQQVGMVGSKLLDYFRNDVIQAAGGGRTSRWRGLTRHLGRDQLDNGQWDDVLEPDYITGASLLVKRETVEDIGLLEERYFLYSEEVDWCLRAREKGWKLLYSPRSRVWHKGGATVRYGSPLHDYYTVRSMLLLVHKFHPVLLPLTLAYSVFRCLAPKIVRFQFDRQSAILRAYWDFFRMITPKGRSRRAPHPSFRTHPSIRSG